MRRVGVGLPANHPVWRFRFEVFTPSLKELGWIGGTNIIFDTRYSADDRDEPHPALRDLVAKRVEVMVARLPPARRLRQYRHLPPPDNANGWYIADFNAHLPASRSLAIPAERAKAEHRARKSR